MYLPLAILAPDSDCNMVCVANDAELCGAGNRLAVYVDSSQPPLNLETCLNSVQLQSIDPPVFNFDLEGHYIPAFPGAPVSVPGILGNFQESGGIQVIVVSIHPILFTYFVQGGLIDLRTQERVESQPHTYTMSSSGNLDAFTTAPFPGFPGAWAMTPIPGSPQIFNVNPDGLPSTAIGFQYCALVGNQTFFFFFSLRYSKNVFFLYIAQFLEHFNLHRPARPWCQFPVSYMGFLPYWRGIPS